MNPSRLALWLPLLAAAFLPLPALASEGGGLAEQVTLPLVIPFAGLLLSIAILPMTAGHWWHRNRNQLLVALAWAAPVLGWLLWRMSDAAVGHDAGHALAHALEEYVSFIALLASLYIISGGIVLRGDLKATPAVNTAFLAVGAVIANLVGTTGASMLLIRPLLKTNSERQFVRHIPIFFIFLVSNVGGALTPIGDPPLFLGYLRGIPFFWTLEHVWPMWLTAVLLLLATFFALDTWYYRKESPADLGLDKARVEPLRLSGGINFGLLAGVILSVLFLSPVQGAHDFRDYFAREIAMALLALASWKVTPRELHRANAFTFGPILEVAALFIGIFITMVPATMMLQAHGAELGLDKPWQYFWATGSLSSFLDNAPTYVTFAAMACGASDLCQAAENLHPLTVDPSTHLILVAISCGAVFMGANSYIGNGPNFMVKAIAEERGYDMPSFFGYMGVAALLLGPVLVLTTVVFFL